MRVSARSPTSHRSVASVTVASVPERRSEIGLCRALGASRRYVAEQFPTEGVLLSGLGGVAGIFCGVLATVVSARSRAGRSRSLSWPCLTPASLPSRERRSASDGASAKARS